MKRNGHSFMEMMVVLSVLAGMAALAYPMLKSPLNKMHLKAAAQEVSTELSKTRLKAMQTGVVQVFQVQLHTGKFHSAPMDEEPEPEIDEEVERSPLNEIADKIIEEKELPSGICFDMPDVEQNVQEWTNVAVFYPNGDTNNAAISLMDKTDMHIDVKVSGLTGSSKIGDCYRDD